MVIRGGPSLSFRGVDESANRDWCIEDSCCWSCADAIAKAIFFKSSGKFGARRVDADLLQHLFNVNCSFKDQRRYRATGENRFADLCRKLRHDVTQLVDGDGNATAPIGRKICLNSLIDDILFEAGRDLLDDLHNEIVERLEIRLDATLGPNVCRIVDRLQPRGGRGR